MKTFQVLLDSTSDVEKKFRDELELDYCRMSFTLDDDNYIADLDWSEITPHDFYEAMIEGKRSITGLVPIPEFEKRFRMYLDKGLDVLYIACSSKLSGSIQAAQLVAEELSKEYPDRKIVCFDSLRSNYAQGIMGMDAAKLGLEGKNIDEVVEYLQQHRLNYQVHATVSTLKYLKLAGRIKATSAFFGNLLGVKPIIVSDSKGHNYAYKKVKGKKTSYDELIQIVKDRMFDPQNSKLFIEHADCLEDAMYFADALKDYVKEINVSMLGPIIGTAIGPGSITLNFFGKEVDFSIEDEE